MEDGWMLQGHLQTGSAEAADMQRVQLTCFNTLQRIPHSCCTKYPPRRQRCLTRGVVYHSIPTWLRHAANCKSSKGLVMMDTSSKEYFCCFGGQVFKCSCVVLYCLCLTVH